MKRKQLCNNHCCTFYRKAEVSYFQHNRNYMTNKHTYTGKYTFIASGYSC